MSTFFNMDFSVAIAFDYTIIFVSFGEVSLENVNHVEGKQKEGLVYARVESERGATDPWQ